jgi:hypothetical protein
MNQVLVEKLKELRLAHPYWRDWRMTAWRRYREGLPVNRKRIHGLMREKGLLVEQERRKALRTSQRPKPKATRPNEYWGIDMRKFLPRIIANLGCHGGDFFGQLLLTILNRLSWSGDIRFQGAQILNGKPYELSKPSMYRIYPNGKRSVYLEG